MASRDWRRHWTWSRAAAHAICPLNALRPEADRFTHARGRGIAAVCHCYVGRLGTGEQSVADPTDAGSASRMRSSSKAHGGIRESPVNAHIRAIASDKAGLATNEAGERGPRAADGLRAGRAWMTDNLNQVWRSLTWSLLCQFP